LGASTLGRGKCDPDEGTIHDLKESLKVINNLHLL
jgi:hypothetical protein